MKINPTTLLFEDLTNLEALALENEADSVTEGRPYWMEGPMIQAWFKAGGFEDRQKFLVATTVFPARAFKSLTNLFAMKC
jgi:hypothetical protein